MIEPLEKSIAEAIAPSMRGLSPKSVNSLEVFVVDLQHKISDVLQSSVDSLSDEVLIEMRVKKDRFEILRLQIAVLKSMSEYAEKKLNEKESQ